LRFEITHEFDAPLDAVELAILSPDLGVLMARALAPLIESIETVEHVIERELFRRVLLLAAFGGGIAAPSANRYGRISPTRAADVREELGDRVALVLDGGDCEVGLESTIVACLDGRVTLLRPGAVSRSQVADVVGPVSDPDADAPRVPGRLRSHYAPLTPLAILDAAGLQREVAAAVAAGESIAVLARGVVLPASESVLWRRLPADPAAYGRALYASLRLLDRAGAMRILVEAVPGDEAWTAIADRLARAAARGPEPAAGEVIDAT
jgi:L-threonylcarbamoyladenylate synthase